MSIELAIDMPANSAYIRLIDGAIAKSKVINEDVIIDLDEFDQVVGIEILDLDAEIPFTILIKDHHIRPETIEVLRKLRPSISGFMSLFSSDDASVSGTRVGVGSSQ